MALIKKLWDILIDLAEELHEYRRKNHIRGMY
jgi:hypothetical protein